MGLNNKGFHVGHATIRRVHSLEIGGRVRAVNASATGIDGHEPYDVDTQLTQVGQLGGSSLEGAFGRYASHIHFVDNLILGTQRLSIVYIERFYLSGTRGGSTSGRRRFTTLVGPAACHHRQSQQK